VRDTKSSNKKPSQKVEKLHPGKIELESLDPSSTERNHAEDLTRTERNLAIKLSAVTGLEEGLRLCLETAIEASGMDCGGIYLINEPSGTVDLLLHKGLSHDFISSVSHYGFDSPNVTLLKKGKPIYTKHHRLAVPLGKNEKREALHAMAIIPIPYKGRVLACMNVASHTLAEVPVWARAGLETIAAQIGSTIVRLKAEEALKESEEKFRNLAEQSPNMIFINKMGRVVYANKKCEEVMGYERNELYSPDFDFMNLIAPESRDFVRASFRRHMNSEEIPPYEYALITKKGQKIDAILTTKLIKYDGETAILGTVTDITERKRMEETLRESEQKYRALVEQSSQGIVILQDFRIIFANATAAEIAGLTMEEILALSLQDMMTFVYPEEKSATLERLKNRFAGRNEPENYELRLVRKNGDTFWLNLFFSPIVYQAKPAIQLAFVDITERKKAEEKLLDYQGRLKSLASQLTLAEERERLHIATELHDRISQSLAISKLKIEQLRDSAPDKKFDKMLNEIAESIGHTIAETQSLIYGIRPPPLSVLGFAKTVAEWLNKEISQKHGIEVEFEDDEQPKPLDENTSALLFRDVRELLTNVIKHANAHRVKVAIRKIDTRIQVRVEDDGRGFDPVKVATQAVREGAFGLFSIQERLEGTGGLLQIESKPGRGTKITITAPLKADNLEGTKL
jgi:PAS domain S-box-containing protein